MTEKTENKIRIKAKQVTDNLISFMQELDTVTNKENKELKMDAEYYQEHIEDLEKENAELKERLKEHESIGNAQFWENVWSWKSKAEQLTKAKNLLQKVADICGYPNYDIPVELYADIADFLKDSEVEK